MLKYDLLLPCAEVVEGPPIQATSRLLNSDRHLLVARPARRLLSPVVAAVFASLAEDAVVSSSVVAAVFCLSSWPPSSRLSPWPPSSRLSSWPPSFCLISPVPNLFSSFYLISPVPNLFSPLLVMIRCSEEHRVCFAKEQCLVFITPTRSDLM